MNTYNKKIFLLPDSHRSMACIHAKVMEDSIMKVTIHDCNKSIQLHNNLGNSDEVQEAIEKLTNLEYEINSLILFIKENYDSNQQR